MLIEIAVDEVVVMWPTAHTNKLNSLSYMWVTC